MGLKLQHLIIFIGCLFLNRLLSRAEPLSGGKVERIIQPSFKRIVAIAKDDKRHSRSDNQLCSGYVMSRNIVLTTERCVSGRNPTELVVYAEANSFQKSKAHTVCGWTSYNQQSFSGNSEDQPLDLAIHDIAVVKLCKNLKGDSFVQQGRSSKKTIEELEGSSAMMVGWGKLNYKSLDNYKTRALVTILSPKVCGEITNWRSFESGRFICTAADPYVLATPNDYGGPLLFKNRYIIGITTGVFKTNGAFRPGVNIHANVTFYKKFLNQFLLL